MTEPTIEFGSRPFRREKETPTSPEPGRIGKSWPRKLSFSRPFFLARILKASLLSKVRYGLALRFFSIKKQKTLIKIARLHSLGIKLAPW